MADIIGRVVLRGRIELQFGEKLQVLFFQCTGPTEIFSILP